MKIYKLSGALLTAIVALFSVIFSSCTKEELVNPPKVTLKTDWTNRTEGIDIPSTYNVILDNKNLTFKTTTNILPELETGTHPVTIYNSADKVTINGSTAIVATSDNIVDAQPGWLFYSSLDVVYENDKENNITAVMQQQIRLLNIEMTITDGDVSNIESITASLSGVANTMDLKANNYSGTGLKVIPVFTQTGSKFKSSVRLIGLTSAPQELTLDVTYKDGNYQQIVSDVSSSLSNFGKDKYIPLTLKGDAKIFTSVKMEMQINAWEIQDEINGKPEIQW
ncbi:MAG: FimB/Mfa2 family fimbrial subunit [Dysgonomonas sp.]